MTPLRILELRTTYRDGGGPDKTILLSAARHAPARFQVHCLYLRSAYDDAFTIGRRALELGISYSEVLERHALDPRAIAALAHQLRRFRPHVIHTHDYKTDLLGYLLRPFYPEAALLATAHGWTLDNSRMRLYNALDRRILRLYHQVIAVSQDTRKKLLEVGISPARVQVLYNGIDVDHWRPAAREPAAAALRQMLELPDQARLIGFIGRLSPEKDVPLALQVAQRVLSQVPEAHLLVVGDGVELEALAGRIAELTVRDRIHVLGHRRVDPALYQALDAYLMTSRTEGLPNTLLEAMACAIPSVATAVGGIPELVSSSGGARLCPHGDAAGLSAELLELLSNPLAAAQIARAARARILEAFSFADRLSRIEAIYEALVHRSLPTGSAPAGFRS